MYMMHVDMKALLKEYHSINTTKSESISPLYILQPPPVFSAPSTCIREWSENPDYKGCFMNNPNLESFIKFGKFNIADYSLITIFYK